jgi:hypothetical protein
MMPEHREPQFGETDALAALEEPLRTILEHLCDFDKDWRPMGAMERAQDALAALDRVRDLRTESES